MELYSSSGHGRFWFFNSGGRGQPESDTNTGEPVGVWRRHSKVGVGSGGGESGVKLLLAPSTSLRLYYTGMVRTMYHTGSLFFVS